MVVCAAHADPHAFPLTSCLARTGLQIIQLAKDKELQLRLEEEARLAAEEADRANAAVRTMSKYVHASAPTHSTCVLVRTGSSASRGTGPPGGRVRQSPRRAGDNGRESREGQEQEQEETEKEGRGTGSEHIF